MTSTCPLRTLDVISQDLLQEASETHERKFSYTLCEGLSKITSPPTIYYLISSILCLGVLLLIFFPRKPEVLTREEKGRRDMEVDKAFVRPSMSALRFCWGTATAPIILCPFVPRLPLELLQEILFWSDKKTLSQSALVCSAFLRPSRRHICLNIDTHPRATCLGDLLRSPYETLSANITCILLGERRSTEVTGMPLLRPNLAQWTRVLCFLKLKGAKIKNVTIDEHPLLVMILHEHFPDIHSLSYKFNPTTGSIVTVKERDLVLVLQALDLFRQLRALSLIVKHTARWDVRIPALKGIAKGGLGITTLRLDGRWNASLMAWLTGRCRDLVAIELLGNGLSTDADSRIMYHFALRQKETLRYLLWTPGGSKTFPVIQDFDCPLTLKLHIPKCLLTPSTIGETAEMWHRMLQRSYGQRAQLTTTSRALEAIMETKYNYINVFRTSSV